jgi:hypothetical protein
MAMSRTSAIVRNDEPRTELVKVQPLSGAATDALDREVDDYGVKAALLPLKPFTIEGAITWLDWEEYGATRPGTPSESEGLKFLIRIDAVEEPEFVNGKQVRQPAVLKAGQECPQIYFARHPKLTFALPEMAVHRKRLFDHIQPGVKPSEVLKQLRNQTIEIPVRMTRQYVRTTRNGADIFTDVFEALQG